MPRDDGRPRGPRYRRISTRLWGDERFCALSKPKPNGQSLWIFLLTGPHTGPVPGLFSAGEAALAEVLGWPLAAFRRCWRELEQRGLVHADWRARVVWLPNAVRHNSPESPNVVRSWRAAIDDIPESALKGDALQSLQAFAEGLGEPYAKAFAEASGEKHPHPLANQDQEQEQEQEQEGRAPHASAKPSNGRTGSGVMGGALPREHLSHAACDETYSRCVPRAVHDKLANLLAPKHAGDRAAAGEALRGWYPTVWATLPVDFVMSDAFKFWQGRFDAAFATKDAPRAAAGRPVLVCQHRHTPVCQDPVACSARYLREMQTPPNATPAEVRA